MLILRVIIINNSNLIIINNSTLTATIIKILNLIIKIMIII